MNQFKMRAKTKARAAKKVSRNISIALLTLILGIGTVSATSIVPANYVEPSNANITYLGNQANQANQGNPTENLDIIQLDAGDTNDFSSGSGGGGYSSNSSGRGGARFSVVGGLGALVLILVVAAIKYFNNHNNGPKGGGTGGNPTGGSSGSSGSSGNINTTRMVDSAKHQLDNFRYNPRASAGQNTERMLGNLASGAIGGLAVGLIGDMLGTNGSNPTNGPTDPSTLAEDLKAFKQLDPGFSGDKFLAHTTDLWIKMQIAWSNNDLDGLSGVESKSLYSTHESQLTELIKNNWHNRVARPLITDSHIISTRQDENLQYITIRANTRMLDYVEDSTGKLIKGSKTNLITPSYDIEYCRSKSAKTIEMDENSNLKCPQCGAPTAIRTAGTCDYCGFVIRVADSDWTINKIKRLTQS